MNEDIPTYSIVWLKIIAVVQVIVGLAITFVGSYFMTGSMPLFSFFIICFGLFLVYAGVQSFRARLSGFNWNLSCMLLIVCGGFITYNIWMAAPPPSSGITTQAAFSPILYYQCLSAALSGMVGGILSGKYEKYQLRKSLKTPSKTQ